MAEKATGVLVPMAMPRVCMNNLPLNLRESSSSMSRKIYRKSFLGIGKLCLWCEHRMVG